MIPPKFILFIFGLILFSSCSSEYVEGQLPRIALKCNIIGSESSIKTYSRSGSEKVPHYISGVVLTVENMEYDVEDVVKQYDYNDTENNADIVELNNITVGENKITAKGVCNNPALNSYYASVQKCNDDNLNERAKQYAEDLKVIHPIYADYMIENPIIKDISINDNNNLVNVNMITQNHRVAIVIENSGESNYILKVSVLGKDGSELLGTDNYIRINSQHAMIINNSNASGDKTYTVNIKYFTKDSEIEILEKNITREIRASEGSNITKLYHFSKNNLLESDSDALFAWDQMNDIISGETIE